MIFDGARVPADRLIGEEGDGHADRAVGARRRPARHRRGRRPASPRRRSTTRSAYAGSASSSASRSASFQGLQFLLADMAAAVERPGRRTCTRRGSRTPAGRSAAQASIAKLTATDAAMRVTTDAVQVLGGYGYTRDFPVERYMREAKVTQIFEGTNQIQRMVIGRDLLRS